MQHITVLPTILFSVIAAFLVILGKRNFDESYEDIASVGKRFGIGRLLQRMKDEQQRKPMDSKRFGPSNWYNRMNKDKLRLMNLGK